MSSDRPSKDQIDALISRATHGDGMAIDSLLRHFRPYLRVLCGLRFPELYQRRDDASDIVQQTLFAASRGIEEFRGSSVEELEAWMLKLLERNALQSLRRHRAARRDVRLEEEGVVREDSGHFAWHTIADDGSTPSQSVIRGEAALMLAEVLATLPDAQRPPSNCDFSDIERSMRSPRSWK